MTRRSLVSLVALVPGAAAALNTHNTNPDSEAATVEGLYVSLRGSNVSSKKPLMEVRWSRPNGGSYHGSRFEAWVAGPGGTSVPTGFHFVDDPSLDGNSREAMAVMSAEDLLSTGANGSFRLVARPILANGDVAAYRPGITPEVTVQLRRA